MSTDLSTLDRKLVNNDFYDTLGTGWGDDSNAAVMLLRREGELKNQWVAERLAELCPPGAQVLDVGCGGGFLTNHLGQRGLDVTGMDLSLTSLTHARSSDSSGKVRYVHGDAYALPFDDSSFDALTCLDFLEHVSEPARVVAEAARALRPGGLFFYHTFNRNPLATLFAAKGLEWFVNGTPEKLHAPELFIKPTELHAMMQQGGLARVEERGLRPQFNGAFLRMLFTGEVSSRFCFRWTNSTAISYAGFARKQS